MELEHCGSDSETYLIQKQKGRIRDKFGSNVDAFPLATANSAHDLIPNHGVLHLAESKLLHYSLDSKSLLFPSHGRRKTEQRGIGQLFLDSKLGKHVIVLQDISGLLCKLVVVTTFAIDQNLTSRFSTRAGNATSKQIEQSGLARTRGSHDGEHGSSSDIAGDTLEDYLLIAFGLGLVRLRSFRVRILGLFHLDRNGKGEILPKEVNALFSLACGCGLETLIDCVLGSVGIIRDVDPFVDDLFMYRQRATDKANRGVIGAPVSIKIVEDNARTFCIPEPN